MRWRLGGLAAFVLTFGAVTQPAAGSPAGTVQAEPDDIMARTVEANPGSVQISENVIQLDEGILMIRSPHSDVSAQRLQDCRSGYQCGWAHADFSPVDDWIIAANRCTYVDYFRFQFWNAHEGIWDDWAYDVSSVFNNMPGVTWSQFWSPRNNANYNAHVGAPAHYVGDKWNDSFTAAQGCSGAAH